MSRQITALKRDRVIELSSNRRVKVLVLTLLLAETGMMRTMGCPADITATDELDTRLLVSSARPAVTANLMARRFAAL